jgi:short-subunit dehydrogenase
MTEATNNRPLAVVTGASSGIGFELAPQFAEHGYDLIIAAEDDGINTAAAQLANGSTVEAVQVDLANEDGVDGSTSRSARARTVHDPGAAGDSHLASLQRRRVTRFLGATRFLCGSRG